MADPTLTNDFTPTTTADFTSVGPEVSTVTDKPVPTAEEKIQSGKDVAAGAVRYGIPAVAGIANPSLSIPVLIMQALTAGGSEFAARRIERAESDPELDTLWNDLKAGGATGVLDLGVNLAFKGMGKAFRKVGEKFFMPSEMPLDVRIQTAQDVLGEIPAEPMKEPGKLRRFVNFVTRNNAKRPFSLTFGQINAEEQRFINWLEGIARAGIGSRGKMASFDLRNETALKDLIERYVTSRATETTGPEFAVFAKRIIGDLKQPKAGVGEMFLPVEAYRKYLYIQFENALSESGAVVDGTKLRQFILGNELAEEGLTRKVYNALRSEGLVPPLEPAAKTQQSFRRTTTERISGAMEEGVGASQKKSLLTGKVQQSADVTKDVGFKSTRSQNLTRTETESLVGMSEEELAAEWSSLPSADVDKIIKTLNSFWEDDVTKGSAAKRINRLLRGMKDKVEPRFEKAMGKEVTKLRDDANAFFGKEKDYLHDVAIKAFRKTLSRNPSKVMSLLGGGTTMPNAKMTYDKLMTLKKALQFSSETPRVGDALTKAVSESGFPAGREAMQQMYDDAFLKPLRYRMIVDSADGVGHLDPDRFLKILDKNADVPEFFEEVFGGAEQVDRIKRLMTALSTATKNVPDKNIFIQLMQAGALTTGVGGAIFADDPQLKASSLASGALVFLGPYALARMLTNSTMTRAFIDGLKAGVRSGRFAMALRKVAEMKVASSFWEDNPSGDAVGFYTSVGQPPK